LILLDGSQIQNPQPQTIPLPYIPSLLQSGNSVHINTKSTEIKNIRVKNLSGELVSPHMVLEKGITIYTVGLSKGFYGVKVITNNNALEVYRCD
jgi:hypothetical protein